MNVNKNVIIALFFCLPFSLYASGYSIEATFYWPDGGKETAVVYSYLNKNNHWKGDRGYYMDTGLYKNKQLFVPWNKVKRIELTPFVKKADTPNVRITLTDGSTRNGFDYDVKAAANWQGVEAKFIKWNKLETKKIKIVPHPPSDPMSSCNGASGCSGRNITNWGIWRFTTNDKPSLVTLITGAFGISRSTGSRDRHGNYIPVGGFPEDAFLSRYKTEHFNIRTKPLVTLDKIDFLFDKPSGQISFNFRNGKRGKILYTRQDTRDLYSSGFIGWSYFGSYQVRTIISFPNLKKMELTKSSAFSKIKSTFKAATQPHVKWKITLNNGQTIKTDEIEGYQKQLVPIAPPKGQTWLVRPGREIGVMGGKYVIVRHSSGYHIVPLSIVQTIIPGELLITLRQDASGKQVNFSRFHPGKYWVNTGVSGRTYIDDDADKKITSKELTILKYKQKGTFKSVPFSEIKKISQF